MNDCFGIGSLSEEGLETCNKRLRRVCEFHARKVSLTANLTDCLTRMWISSDTVVNSIKEKAGKYCRHCNCYDHGYWYYPKQKIISNSKFDDIIFNS